MVGGVGGGGVWGWGRGQGLSVSPFQGCGLRRNSDFGSRSALGTAPGTSLPFPTNQRLCPLLCLPQNIPFVLYHHLNHEDNRPLLPHLLPRLAAPGAGLPGLRLLRVLCAAFFRPEWYCGRARISSAVGAFSTVYRASLPHWAGEGTVVLKLVDTPRHIQDRCAQARGGRAQGGGMLGLRRASHGDSVQTQSFWLLLHGNEVADLSLRVACIARAHALPDSLARCLTALPAACLPACLPCWLPDSPVFCLPAWPPPGGRPGRGVYPAGAGRLPPRLPAVRLWSGPGSRRHVPGAQGLPLLPQVWARWAFAPRSSGLSLLECCCVSHR